MHLERKQEEGEGGIDEGIEKTRASRVETQMNAWGKNSEESGCEAGLVIERGNGETMIRNAMNIDRLLVHAHNFLVFLP